MRKLLRRMRWDTKTWLALTAICIILASIWPIFGPIGFIIGILYAIDPLWLPVMRWIFRSISGNIGVNNYNRKVSTYNNDVDAYNTHIKEWNR